MATQVQNRRGSTAEHSTFTGAVAELTVDTDKDVVVVHDGSTAGGHPMLKQDGSNSALALGSASSPSLKFTGDTNTGIYSPGADQVAISTNGVGRLFIDASGNVGVGGSANVGSAPFGVYVNTATQNGFAFKTTTDGAFGALRALNAAGTETCNIQYDTSNQFIALRTANTERMRLDSSGRLGLGTSCPLKRLDVAGDISLSSGGANVLRVLQNVSAAAYTGPGFYSATSIGYGVASGGTHRWIGGGDGNIELMRLTSTGLGIGTTSPAEAFTLGSGNAQITSGQLTVGVTSTSGLQFINDGTLGTLNSIPLILRTASTERARIDTSGRLLVGTSTDVSGNEPAALIQSVYSTGALTSIGRDDISVNNNDFIGGIDFHTKTGASSTWQRSARILCYADADQGSGDAPGRLVFSTCPDNSASPVERLRITQSGGVYVNVTSSSAPVVGNERLGVDGGSGIAISGKTSVNTEPVCALANLSNTNNAYMMRFYSGSGGTTRGEIYYNGSQLVYATSSDYRLKENVQPLLGGIELVSRLRPVTYQWIENQNHDIGFIAHEVQEVFPNAVGGDKDAVDENGKILPQTYDPSKLVPLLTAALQEAIGRIETLEAEVAALKAS